MRAERFGLPNEELEKEKKKQRAERFGTANADLDAEKIKQRKERFGIVSDADKIKARQERFGTATANGGTNSKLDSALPEPKNKRQNNSAELDDEAKKKQARLERYQLHLYLYLI